MYFTFKSGRKTFQIHKSVKKMTFDEIEEKYKGVLDYKSLCEQLGIKKKYKPRKTEKKAD